MDERTLFEEHFAKFFPEKWTEKELSYFIDTKDLTLDMPALRVNLNAPIRDFVLRGGKRLRPTLFFRTLEAFKIDPAKYSDVAVLIELVHNATLMLDDIEDRAKERRGKPTSHLTFGLDTATNTGMALHLMPLKILMENQLGLSDQTKIRLWGIFTDELSNLSIGQALDIYWHKHQKNHITIDKYLTMVSLKTGSLFRMAIRYAVAVANLPVEVEKDFAQFASDIGTAFQIMDDVLDLTVDHTVFGKSYGNDITEGKMSLPVLYALKMSQEDNSNTLKAILSRHTRNKALIRQAILIIQSSGGLERAKESAEKKLLLSVEKLNAKYGSVYDLTPVLELATRFVKRDH